MRKIMPLYSSYNVVWSLGLELGLGAVGLRSLGLAGLGAELWKRNSIINVGLALNSRIASTEGSGWDVPTIIFFTN